MIHISAGPCYVITAPMYSTHMAFKRGGWCLLNHRNDIELTAKTENLYFHGFTLFCDLSPICNMKHYISTHIISKK